MIHFEIYFSVLQRKALETNDFASLTELAVRLYPFERHYEGLAKPFAWQFTRIASASDCRMVRAHAASSPIGSRVHRFQLIEATVAQALGRINRLLPLRAIIVKHSAIS